MVYTQTTGGTNLQFSSSRLRRSFTRLHFTTETIVAEQVFQLIVGNFLRRTRRLTSAHQNRASCTLGESVSTRI